MTQKLIGKFRPGYAALFAVLILSVTCGTLPGQDQQEAIQNIMYQSGQVVVPSYEGWHPNTDGTIDLWFGYLNLNWKEELDIPVGPDNTITPAEYGPDAGQPTHFLPRTNHWQFSIRVPKDFGSKEIIWTLTSHGKTYRTYASLKPGYIHDDMGMQREFYGTPPPGNLPPVLTLKGERHRTVKVDQPIELTALATDDGLPSVGGRAAADDAGATGGGGRAGRGAGGGGGGAGGGASGGLAIGGDSVRGVAKGLRLAWYVYRGKNEVTFDPPQFKVWEDQRGGSPWAPGWVNPRIPLENTWVVHVTFREPGTYVLRCQASDGLWNTNENVTFVVTK